MSGIIDNILRDLKSEQSSVRVRAIENLSDQLGGIDIPSVEMKAAFANLVAIASKDTPYEEREAALNTLLTGWENNLLDKVDMTPLSQAYDSLQEDLQEYADVLLGKV